MEEKLDAILVSVRKLEKKVQNLEDRINDIDRDMAEDRKDFQDIKIKFGEVVAEVGQLRGSTNIMSDQVKNKVVDALKPMQESVEELNDTIEKKKSIPVKKLGFFKRIMFELKSEFKGGVK